MCSKNSTGIQPWQRHMSKLKLLIALGVDKCAIYLCWLCMFDCHWACGAKRDFLNGAKRGCNETVLFTFTMFRFAPRVGQNGKNIEPNSSISDK